MDDIPSNRLIAEAMLRQLGGGVLMASDGREALRVLDSAVVDLVLLDLSMPGISGMEVCQNTRANNVLAGLPVIACTAHAQPEDRRNFIANGFNEILIKPVSRETMANTVRAGDASLRALSAYPPHGFAPPVRGGEITDFPRCSSCQFMWRGLTKKPQR